VYTFSSSNLAEAFYGQPRDTPLERRIPTEVDQSTIEALLTPRTSRQAKCTYREDTLQLKDIEDEKLSLD
jgi:hypothetical protein